MKQIEVKIYRKGLIRKFVLEYTLIFSNEKQVEEFMLSLNADTDFLEVGDIMIRRSLINKVTKEEK